MTTNLYINIKTTITKLYHISDIHIRRYDRHNEYQIVFNNLYSFLQENCKNDSLIVITGDLLHNKDNLTPDCIIITYNFLMNLSMIRPVILIPGNHDFVETNTHIKDSIGAILSDHDIPNLYYLRNSGFFRYCNVVFGVMSIFDKIDIDVTNYCKKDTDILVGLYHGPVGTTETAIGIMLQGDKKPSDFDEFDYVLLGDIHKYQHIKKNIAYASSLISQNFSETDEYHGVLWWDIINGETKYIIIDNPYRHMTFDIINNTLYNGKTEIMPTAYTFPPNARIRLNITNTSSTECTAIKKQIRTHSANIVFYDNVIVDPINSPKMVKIDYFQMLDPFIDKLNTIEKNECKHIFQTQLNKINLNVDKLCFQWELIDLKFSNLFAYGMNNFIDFTKLPFNEIVGLFAPNSHGKSSLIDIILLSLYDNFSRNTESRYRTIPSYIVNNNMTTFEIIIRFKLGNDTYIIDKKGKVVGKNTSKTGKRIEFTHYNFIKQSNGTDINLTRKDRFETQKEIDNIIGSYNDFCLTTLFLQNRERNFYDMNTTDRKTFLYKMLCLDKFETIYDYFNVQERESHVKLKNTWEQITQFNCETVTNNIINYNKTITRYNKKLEALNYIKLQCNKKRKYYMTKLNNYHGDNINVNYTQEHIPMLHKIIDIINIIVDTNIEIHNKPIPDIVHNIQYKHPAQIDDEIIHCAQQCTNLFEQSKKSKNMINDIEYKIKLLDDHINNNYINIKCDTCMKRKDKYNMMILEREQCHIQKNNIMLQNTDDMYKLIQKYGYTGVNDIESLQQYINKYCCDYIQNYNNFIDMVKNHYKNTHCYHNIDTPKMIAIKNQLITNIKYIKNNNILQKIDKIEQKLEKIDANIMMCNKELNKITYNLALEESQLAQYNDLTNNINTYTTNHNIYHALKKATHINGIPSIIISSRLNDININVNMMIAPFISKQVNIIADGNNILVHILDNTGNIINILGGMELFIINIAFKIALAGISILPKNKMLIIDEGVSVLDKTHIDKFHNIAQFLNSNYNHVILISHIDGLKDHITQFMNIIKNNGKSYINYA